MILNIFPQKKKNCADALSRLPQGNKSRESYVEEASYINFIEKFLPVTNGTVRIATSKDSILSRIMLYIQAGWPSSCSTEEFKAFFLKKNELYIDRGCVMWEYRIVIPITLQKLVLQQLHASHMGIVKTKSLMRSYVWWPNIDSDVEEMCKQCVICSAESQAAPRVLPQPWPYHTQPWSKIHIDFLGPLNGKTFLVLIDSTTKWLEIMEMYRTNASSVIKNLRSTFAHFGLPIEVVSDQGPPFTSSEFREFLKINGIRQSFSPTYHPSSNGAAENAVKICKRAIKKTTREAI